jgi:hypothetical protein
VNSSGAHALFSGCLGGPRTWSQRQFPDVSKDLSLSLSKDNIVSYFNMFNLVPSPSSLQFICTMYFASLVHRQLLTLYNNTDVLHREKEPSLGIEFFYPHILFRYFTFFTWRTLSLSELSKCLILTSVWIWVKTGLHGIQPSTRIK